MNSEMGIAPVTLEGKHVRLEPLSESHHAALTKVGLNEELWRWIPVPVSTPEEMAAYIGTALDEQARGVSPFAIVEKTGGCSIGSTRYSNIDRANRRVEIGWTWVAGAWQRTPINTEAKYLLLRHAFETLGCIRVELKTDSLNTASGGIRHSVYFSIIDSEWPEVKTRLESKLNR